MQPGTRLGPYEIVAAIGSGGMGEVYRARDTRLDRDVAIKVLPSHVALDPEARVRFEREAKAVAALSHPNILALHDVGAEGDTAFAVTELLHGETLRARLGADATNQSALPVRKALEIAIQIARGLAAAHGRGIVHRDLKPENIFLTTDGHAKILDFGLSKTTATQGSGATTRLRVTDPGTVMGTAGYMAPEQVRGADVDHRADIFALGCVLYEMLVGKRAFERPTAAETMASVLKDDPSPLSIPGQIPAPLDAIVRHCLEKPPDDRFQSARDLTFALESASGSSPSLSSSGVRTVAARPVNWRWAAVTVAIAGITGLGVWWATRDNVSVPADGSVIRADMVLPGITMPSLFDKDDSVMALSPDGRHLAVATPDHTRLLLHNLETGQTRTLVQGAEVGEPVFSPDGRFVAFVEGSGSSVRSDIWGSIKKVAITGGAATLIADGITGLKGAAWGDDGYLYYCPSPPMGLWRASADRLGPPEKLTEPDVKQGEKTHRLPFVLPGGRAVLFTVGTTRISSFDDAKIEVLNLADRTRRRLVEGGTAARYVPTGHLIYQRGGQLLGVRFDLDSLTTSGAPVAVAEGIAYLTASGTSYHTVSPSGLLMFLPLGPKPTSQIVLIDRRNRSTKIADSPPLIASGSLSPDERHLAIDPDGATRQIAIIDLSRNLLQQFTFEFDNAVPLWTQDGSRLVFLSNATGRNRLYSQASDGSGKPEPLVPHTGDGDMYPTSIRDDVVVYETLDSAGKMDLWSVSMTERKPRPLVHTPFDEGAAQISPDGAWLAYQSNQSGRWDVWVQRHPGPGGRQQVSIGGGRRALWQPDSRSLLFQNGTDIMSATVSAAGVGTPTRFVTLEANDILLDMTRDGRLLVHRTAVPPPPTSLRLVVNWFDHVRRVTAGTNSAK